MAELLKRLGLELPIIQAPMAGTSTPALAAAVSNASALGSISVGAVDATSARAMIEALSAQTSKPFNVNVFCHKPAIGRADRERAWLMALEPLFQRYGAEVPTEIGEIYTSFVVDDSMSCRVRQIPPSAALTDPDAALSGTACCRAVDDGFSDSPARAVF